MPPPASPLPPLQSLLTFESAARHLNFTAAAEELGTTQPAVSQRVRGMEDQLGLPLFRRLHRGVRLTAEGEQLFEAVRGSLDALHGAIADLRQQQARGTLTLATDFGFAKLWLLPRMHALRLALPGLELRILTSQDEIDPRRAAPDLHIVFDQAPPQGDAQKLFAEQVVPVCSPVLLRRHGPIASAADLAELPLLHLQPTAPLRWMNWDEWFAAQGVAELGSGGALTFNDYSLVVQAAAAGHGVALGWAPLVDELLDSGELVVAHDRPLRTARGYFLVTPPARQFTGVRARFRDWILQQCGLPEAATTAAGRPAQPTGLPGQPPLHASAPLLRTAALPLQ